MMCTMIWTPAKAMTVSAVDRLVGDDAGHHQPEGDGGQDDRKAETDQIALQCAMARDRRRARVRASVDMGIGSSQHSYQIDKGEDADPDDVEEVPEHAEAHQPPLVGLDEALPAT